MSRILDLKRRFVASRESSASSMISNTWRGTCQSSTTVASKPLTRAEWESRDPNGWERSEFAELGVDIEYEDETKELEDRCEDKSTKVSSRPLSRLEKLRNLYMDIKNPVVEPFVPEENTQKDISRIEAIRRMITSVKKDETIKKNDPKPPRRALHYEHKASCRNCAKESVCRLSCVRERPCMEWSAKIGCEVKWSDYDVKGYLFGK